MKRTKTGFLMLIVTLLFAAGAIQFTALAEDPPADAAVFVTNDYNVGWQLSGNYYDIGNPESLMAGGLMKNIDGFSDYAPSGEGVPGGNSNSSINGSAAAGEEVVTTLITTNPSYGVWDHNIYDFSPWGDNRALAMYVYVYNDSQAIGVDFAGSVAVKAADFVDTHASNIDAARWGTCTLQTWGGNTLTNGSWNRVVVKLIDIGAPVWGWSKTSNPDGLKKVVGISITVAATGGNLITLVNDVMATSSASTAVMHRPAAVFDYQKPSVNVSDISAVANEDTEVDLTPVITDAATSTAFTTELTIEDEGGNEIDVLTEAAAIAAYTFADPGVYTLKYKVTDNFGIIGVAEHEIVINEVGGVDTTAPVIQTTQVPAYANKGAAVSLKPNIVDASDCALTITLSHDGQTVDTLEIASILSADDTDYLVTPTLTGTYTVSYSATDAEGNGPSTASKDIFVVDSSVTKPFTDTDATKYMYPNTLSTNAQLRKYSAGGLEREFIYVTSDGGALKALWTDKQNADHQSAGIDIAGAFENGLTALEFWVYYSGAADNTAAFYLSNRSDTYWTDPATQAILANDKMAGLIESGKMQRVVVRISDFTGVNKDSVLQVVHLFNLHFNVNEGFMLISAVNLIETAEATGIYDAADFTPALTAPTFDIDGVSGGNLMDGESKTKFNLMPSDVSVSDYSIKLKISKGSEEYTLTDKTAIGAYEFAASGVWTLAYTVYDENLNFTTLSKTVTINGAPDYFLPDFTAVYAGTDVDISVTDILVDAGKTAVVYASWEGKTEFELTADNKLQKFAAGTYSVRYRVTDGTLETVKTWEFDAVAEKSVSFGEITADTAYGTDATHSTAHIGNRVLSPEEDGYASIFMDKRTTGLANQYMGFGYELVDQVATTDFADGYLAVSFWFYMENPGDMLYGSFKLTSTNGAMSDFYKWEFTGLGVEAGKWNRIVLTISDAIKEGFPSAAQLQAFYAFGYRASEGQAVVMLADVTLQNYIGTSGVVEKLTPEKPYVFKNPEITLPAFEGGEYDKAGGYDLAPSAITAGDASYDYSGKLTVKRKDGTVYAEVAFTKANYATALAGYSFSTGDEYTLIYTVTDEMGNIGTKEGAIKITGAPADTVKPVITVGSYESSVTASTTVDFSDFVSATDDIDGIVSHKIEYKIYKKGGDLVATVASGDAVKAYKFTAAGEYTVKLNVSDAAGNAADEKSFDITVTKRTETLPTVTLATINDAAPATKYALGSSIELGGITAKDAFGVSLEYTVTVTGPNGEIELDEYDTFTADAEGSYTIVVSATDADGNTGTATVTFTVNKTTAGTDTEGCKSGLSAGGIGMLLILLATAVLVKRRVRA